MLWTEGTSNQSQDQESLVSQRLSVVPASRGSCCCKIPTIHPTCPPSFPRAAKWMDVKVELSSMPLFLARLSGLTPDGN